MKIEKIAEWLINHNSVEFNEDKTATYYLHLDNGQITAGEGDTILTETIDIAEWANDDSPERFYKEFEQIDNPAFLDVAKSFAEQIRRL